MSERKRSKLFQLFWPFEDSYSLDERFVVVKANERWGRAVGEVFLLFAAITVAIGQLLCFFMAAEIRTQIRLVFALALLADLGWVLGVRHTSLSLRTYVTFVQYLTITAFLTYAWWSMSVLTATPMSLALSPAFFLACITAMIAQNPGTTRTAVGMSLYALLGCVIAFTPSRWALHVVAAGLFANALIIRYWMQSTFRKRALWDYRSRLLVAPYPVVYKSIVEEKLVEEAFTPTLRNCVFLLTDIVARARALELRASCFACHELMRQHFPQRNYFFDWIAGELFIVAYQEDGQDMDTLLRSTLALALDLTAQRPDGTTIASDIGIATGEAFVGIMGPRGMRKATAQGEAAGRARRLQAGALLIPRREGARPRIVLEERLVPLLLALVGASAIHVHKLGAGECLQDYGDSVLHYFAPGIPWERLAA